MHGRVGGVGGDPYSHFKSKTLAAPKNPEGTAAA
jgi:hypothetical protein